MWLPNFVFWTCCNNRTYRVMMVINNEKYINYRYWAVVSRMVGSSLLVRQFSCRHCSWRITGGVTQHTPHSLLQTQTSPKANTQAQIHTNTKTFTNVVNTYWGSTPHTPHSLLLRLQRSSQKFIIQNKRTYMYTQANAKHKQWHPGTLADKHTITTETHTHEICSFVWLPLS